jgi:hypothetical protein
MRRDNRCRTTVKENNGGGWTSDGVFLWLGRRQNENVVEWWREWPIFRWFFYSSGGWELDSLRRVAGDGMQIQCFNFGSRRETTGKHCWKMKQRQQAHHGSMYIFSFCLSPRAALSPLHVKEAWHDAASWWRQSEERRHRKGEREEMTSVELTWILLDQKIKKIHVIDSALL